MNVFTYLNNYNVTKTYIAKYDILGDVMKKKFCINDIKCSFGEVECFLKTFSTTAKIVKLKKVLQSIKKDTRRQ